MPLGAITAAVATKGDTGLSWWQELLIVVAGSIAAAAILGALRMIWLRFHTPRITITCGNTELFQRKERALDCHWHLDIGTTPSAVYMTRLEVRETTKKVSAPDVRILVIASDPPFPLDAAESLPVELEWSSRKTTHHLAPGARSHVYLCELVSYRENPDLTWVFGHISDEVLAPGKKVCLDLQPVIAGQRPSKKTIQSFLVDWAEDQPHPSVTATPR